MRIRTDAPADWGRPSQIQDAARKHVRSAAGLLDAFLILEQTADGEGPFDGPLIVAEVDNESQGFAAFADAERTWL